MAGESAVSSIPRPAQLKGLHLTQLKRHIWIAIGLSLASVVVLKVCVNDPRKRKYAEFYKNYDAQASFERMKKAGLFQTVNPNDD